jgi:hypothetical protein
MKRMPKKRYCALSCFLILLTFILIVPPSIPALAAGTTSLTITKYAGNGSTILDQVIINYQEMRDSLPVVGDGITHYYHQGPTFDTGNFWDLDEIINIDSRDMGAARGTDIRDLLALVGGAPAGSEIEVRAIDDFSKRFAADDLDSMENITLVVAWDNPTYGGEVPDYDKGMRLIFFDSNTNAEEKHVFGNWDMHETLQETYWYYYYSGGVYYPSSSGLSVQYVNAINIYIKPPDNGSQCFIATAAYGTPTAEQINVLREFREVVLLQNSVGSEFVALYYQLSPTIADFIARNRLLRTLVREFLVDSLVWIIEATGTIWRN